MAFKVAYKASVEKDLKKLDIKEAGRILNKIEKDLASDPNKGEALKRSFQGLCRYRIGDYRIIYTKTHTGILVLRVAHRKEVYKKR